MASFRTVVLKMVRDGRVLEMRQAAVLMALREAPKDAPPSVGVLALLLSVSKPVVSRAADRLMTMGWLERKQRASDRRLVDLTLTAAGRKVADWMLAA